MNNDHITNQTETTASRVAKPGSKPVDTVNILMVSKRPHILAHRQARWARRAAHA